jgi:hypothetical protein
LIACTISWDSGLVRSTPLISAPQADDNGVTWMSMTSCMGRILGKEILAILQPFMNRDTPGGGQRAGPVVALFPEYLQEQT